MVSFLTDGTEHAVQEARGVCERMANMAEGKPRPTWSIGSVPVPETCSIHGVALLNHTEFWALKAIQTVIADLQLAALGPMTAEKQQTWTEDC